MALGGTFDLLHKGHRKFIKFAFKKSAKVSIGITSDRFVKQTGKNTYQNYKKRNQNLKRFIKQNNFTKRTKIVKLVDVFGSTLKDNTVDALLVTRNSASGGRRINKERKKLGLKSLNIIRFPIVLANNKDPISSGRIRNGLIDTEGKSFLSLLTSAKKFILPNYLRDKLAKPYGKLFTNEGELISQLSKEDKQLITVGDESTVSLSKRGISSNLVIVDFKINRKQVFTKIDELRFEKKFSYSQAINEPGTINNSLVLAIWDFFNKKNPKHSVIKVDGEEDLAVLPTVLLAPLDTLVVYGLRNQGLVQVKVTLEKKSQFVKILEKFDKEIN